MRQIVPFESDAGAQNRSRESTGPSWWTRQGRTFGVNFEGVSLLSCVPCVVGLGPAWKAYMSGIVALQSVELSAQLALQVGEQYNKVVQVIYIAVAGL